MKRISRGMSLLEVVVAIQCTAILLALICRVLPLARRQIKESDQRLGGALAAQSILEEFLAVSPEEWPKDPVRVPDTNLRVKIEALPYQEDARLLRAQVTVFAGNDSTYRLETLVHP